MCEELSLSYMCSSPATKHGCKMLQNEHKWEKFIFRQTSLTFFYIKAYNSRMVVQTVKYKQLITSFPHVRALMMLHYNGNEISTKRKQISESTKSSTTRTVVGINLIDFNRTHF